MPRLIHFTDHELDTAVELLRVARVHCLDLGASLAQTFPDSPLVERMRQYAESADDLTSQIMAAQQ